MKIQRNQNDRALDRTPPQPLDKARKTVETTVDELKAKTEEEIRRSAKRFVRNAKNEALAGWESLGPQSPATYRKMESITKQVEEIQGSAQALTGAVAHLGNLPMDTMIYIATLVRGFVDHLCSPAEHYDFVLSQLPEDIRNAYEDGELRARLGQGLRAEAEWWKSWGEGIVYYAGAIARSPIDIGREGIHRVQLVVDAGETLANQSLQLARDIEALARMIEVNPVSTMPVHRELKA